jgi:hypothetical protein
MKKRTNSRQGLGEDARLWLDGERNCSFFRFKPADELQALWNAHGNSETMFWRRGSGLPITLEKLEGLEDSWLGSAVDDDYGGASFFIGKFYNDDEKQTLFTKRGDQKTTHWEIGMWKPEAK